MGGVVRADCRYQASALALALLLKVGFPENKKLAEVRIIERRGGVVMSLVAHGFAVIKRTNS